MHIWYVCSCPDTPARHLLAKPPRELRAALAEEGAARQVQFVALRFLHEVPKTRFAATSWWHLFSHMVRHFIKGAAVSGCPAKPGVVHIVRWPDWQYSKVADNVISEESEDMQHVIKIFTGLSSSKPRETGHLG